MQLKLNCQFSLILEADLPNQDLKHYSDRNQYKLIPQVVQLECPRVLARICTWLIHLAKLVSVQTGSICFYRTKLSYCHPS